METGVIVRCNSDKFSACIVEMTRNGRGQYVVALYDEKDKRNIYYCDAYDDLGAAIRRFYLW